MTGLPDTGPLILHASAVSVSGRALVIAGQAGSGKSTLALQLLAYGAELIADDRVILTRDGNDVIASAPDAIRGMIEARSVGLLGACPASPAPIRAFVSLDDAETERLPPDRTKRLLGVSFPMFHKSDRTDFAAALLQYMRHGRKDG